MNISKKILLSIMTLSLYADECGIDCYKDIIQGQSINKACAVSGVCIDLEYAKMDGSYIVKLFNAKEEALDKDELYLKGLVYYRAEKRDFAIEAFKKACKIGSASANYALGMINEKNKNEDLAVGYYIEAASVGHSGAFVKLSRLVPARKVEFLTKAAINGESEAMYRLSYLFMNGDGVPQNDVLALAIINYLGVASINSDNQLVRVFFEERNSELRIMKKELINRMKSDEIKEANKMSKRDIFRLIKIS